MTNTQCITLRTVTNVADSHIPLDEFPSGDHDWIADLRADLAEMEEMKRIHGADCYRTFRVAPPLRFLELLAEINGHPDPAAAARYAARVGVVSSQTAT